MAVLLLPASLAAQVPDITEAGPGRIVGMVTSAVTGAPIVSAQVRVRELGRMDFSHTDGSFHLENLPPGEHTLVVQSVGYATVERAVQVTAGGLSQADIRLEISALALPGVVVTGVGRERGVSETYRPTAVLAGVELDRRLSWSLASTLAGQQGISMQSFGSAPAQPIIRGMGGDRVLVLEDGQRTGDLATSGADHAVGIDPVSAERIEVVRGPAGLLYGSNALGGVINVIREEVPRARPEAFSGTLSLAGASVNRGITGAASALVPVGTSFAVRGELSARSGGDTRTPLGRLPSTDAFGLNLSVGASWLPSWGFVGASYRGYRLDHGIPGEFQGEQIPGAHEGGADAETRRHVGRLQLGHFAGLGPFASLQVEGNLIHYVHEEIEGTLANGDRVIGTSFDQITTTWNAVARHDHAAGGFLQEGAIGVFASYKDLITGGSFSGVRDAREVNVAGYFFEEIGTGRYRVQAGARYDWQRIEPVDIRPIDNGEALVPVATRSFGDLSGSIAGLVELRDGWTLGLSVARAFRSPSVSELFSAGPHLADFAYDIGSPDLEQEVGLGTDLFLRVAHPRLNLEATVFRNRIRNFIHSRSTGTLDPRFGRFPLYVATGADAEFIGADGRIQVALRPSLIVEATASWVRAEYEDTGEPLPMIPPLNGSVRIRYETPAYFASLGWQETGAQNRVPFSIPNPQGLGPDIVPESPTDGHRILNAGAGVRWSAAEKRHALTLTVENLLDTTWRDHLSRVKEVAPEPGRNIQLLYRLSF
ncbi:MAG: TonB-dependent receptor [Gemmatimonadota bacterium]